MTEIKHVFKIKLFSRADFWTVRTYDQRNCNEKFAEYVVVRHSNITNLKKLSGSFVAKFIMLSLKFSYG